MTNEEKITVAAKGAVVFGLGLLVLSGLAVTQVVQLGAVIESIAPFSALLGAFNVLLGFSKLSTR